MDSTFLSSSDCPGEKEASAFERERENGWRLPDLGGSEKDKSPLWSMRTMDGGNTAVSHTEVVQGSLSRRF